MNDFYLLFCPRETGVVVCYHRDNEILAKEYIFLHSRWASTTAWRGYSFAKEIPPSHDLLVRLNQYTPLGTYHPIYKSVQSG